MTKLQTQLANLTKGDVLVCRDGTRRTFDLYLTNGDIAATVASPCHWSRTGKWINLSEESNWDIVRVIKARKEKGDRDAKFITDFLANTQLDIPEWIICRLRRIAKRINEVKP